MTRLLKHHQDRYPVVADWLAKSLPQVANSGSVWKAFLEWSHLTDAEARRVLAPESDPIVLLDELHGALGQFTPSRPTLVSLSLDLAKQFDEEQGGTSALLFEATLLHELIHWAWARAGRVEPPRKAGADIGDQFAAQAYGGKLSEAGIGESVRFELAAPGSHDDEDLGSLSRAYESNGKPGAVGRDTNGGWSYGLYQISSAQGTFAKFLEFLAREGRRDPAREKYLAALRAAGGDSAARAGTSDFIAAWRGLAREPEFSDVQHDFIKETHYDVCLTNLRAFKIELANRSLALRNVAWSVSVQHGPARTSLFRRPWDADPACALDDAAFISGIYHERSRVDVYFARSNAKERASVRKRFEDERVRALAMLRAA